MGHKKRTPHQVTGNEGKDERTAEEASDSRVSILRCLQFLKEMAAGLDAQYAKSEAYGLTFGYRPLGLGTMLLSRGQ